MKKLIISSFICTYSLAASFGVFPRVEKVSENHVLRNYPVSTIENFIIASSKDGHKCNDHYGGDFSKLDNRQSKNIISANELASEILKISDAFEIDAGIFAGLIYKESQFCNFGGTIYTRGVPTNKARSSTTGAIGLTMFTSIAVKGIYDQLFESSKKHFHFKVRPMLHRGLYHAGYASTYPSPIDDGDYYKNKVDINDELYQSLPKTKSALTSPSKWKEQILYGAMYLKILLSKRSRPEKFTLKTDIKHYRYAIEEYNGADLNQRTIYWKYIFSLYNDVFDDGFTKRANEQGIWFSSPKWEARKSQIFE